MTDQPDHQHRPHSPIGASGFTRWQACPGSVRLSRGLPNKDSVFSQDGTIGHELLERCMNEGCDAWEHAPDLGITTEHVQGVQVMLDAVRGDIDRYKTQHGESPTVYVEFRVSLKELGYPDAYGTADIVVFFPATGELVVYDFKYGVGIVVEVEGNPQTRYYAAGVILGLPINVSTRVKTVRLTIVQPRAEHEDGLVRSETISLLELSNWVTDVLEPAILATLPEDAPLLAGSHCRFCPAKDALVCPVLNTMFQMFSETPPPPDTLDDVELSAGMVQVEPVRMHCKALLAEGEGRMRRGVQIASHKMVQKKADRVFRPGAAELARKQFGLDATVIKSPAQIEKLPEGKVFVAQHAYKPDNGLVIAPVSDGRAAVVQRTAVEVFAKQLDHGQQGG